MSELQPRKPFKIGEIQLMQLMELLQAPEAPRRPFQAPQMPPGVVPAGTKFALDNNASQQIYGYLNGQPGYCGLGFPGYTYLSELAQRSEYRAPAETMADEMTREWIKFEGVEEDKLKELTDAFEEFGVRQCFHQMVIHDYFFGRGQLYIDVKGQNKPASRDKPLLVKDGGGIKKGSLLGFKSIEPVWSTPYSYNSTDPTQPNFYKPEAWFVVGVRTHATRLLTFIGRPLPDLLKPAYNFSGISMSQLIEPYVVRWLKTADSVNRLISMFSTSGLSTNLESMLADDGALMRRMQLFMQMRDNRGILMLDKDSEEWFQFNVPLGGLSDLQAQSQEHMAAPTHIPMVKLTGVSPTGLNASSEGEIKVFYDHTGAQQENFFGDHLKTVLQAVQLHLWGAIDPKIKATFIPLDTPTDKELAEMRKSDADADIAYVNAGVLSPEEPRERLRTTPNSGYTFITGPAPPPPLDAAHDLDEESADNAHARGEESADNAAKREAKLNKGKDK